MSGVVRFNRYHSADDYYVQVEQIVCWTQTSYGTIVILSNGQRLEVSHRAEDVSKMVSVARAE